MRISEEVFRRAEKALYEYRWLKAYARARREFYLRRSFSANMPEAKKRSSRAYSDPTAYAAVMIASDRKLQEAEETIQAIEKVLVELSPEKKRLVQLRYLSGPRAEWEKIANELKVSRATVFRWREEIVGRVAAGLARGGAPWVSEKSS